ncbi:ATP-dependent RNA helicase HrpA [Arachnia propionica]|uniref:ATP-dependent RNA helicase HrpA n=1 Tax=Arachnia propionica TaxID=1750 RepID=A0A448MZM3_9ACTN|nr:ATP-dependent RNA helicase HrpA [Arachnia propionica]VEH70591.1 ATP-dependent RNA helicase HrpA [Arachnia propionica]
MNPQPRLAFDPALPISAEAPRIAALIRDHQVVVVAGETGSGKTTQLPKICLLAGRERIAHTQPRRIAARTVAHRIAEECGTQLGEFVGYQVRFTRRVSRATRIKVMTDGVLLSELAHDRALERYDTIIIDEAHERSLNIDFLLGYLKQLLERRPELKVIVTSATIDTARFAAHFDDAPIVEVSGRTYPVEIRYRPVGEDDDEVDAVAAAVGDLAATTSSGDVLVFLSGEREIRDAADAVGALKLPGWETVPLYARLAAADQQKVFQAHPGRRVVLATNVAETSITVPGIRFVIDAGTARISRYSARTKVQRLPIEPVSRASANQRAGRCGRLGPGVAIRLYSEEDFNSRPEFTEPEILRTNLATVILQMAQAGLGEIESFPFVEAPVASQISDGLRVLQELGAIKPRRRHERVRLTRTGRLLARMPVDPRLGRMLIEGARRGALRQVQVIVAGLTVPDVRERPSEHQQAADELHRRFTQPPAGETDSPADGEPRRHTVHTGTRPVKQGRGSLAGGDFEALLNVWEYLRRRRRELSGSAFRRLCRAEFLHFVRFREWEDLVSQLREVCRELDLPGEGDAAMDVVLDCLLTGLLSNIGLALPPPPKVQGRRRPLTEYQGARGARFAIAPGSACSRSTPPLVVAYELVETSRLWARTVGPVTAAQIERAAGDLVTRTLSEPTFSPRSATVTASETVTLFGVPIISGRRTNYATNHPEQAREIFIRTGLVEQEWETRNPVVMANRFAYDEAERLTDRMRRPELLISDQALHDFYAARLPAEVVSGATFDKYVKSLGDDSALRLTPADCMTDPGALSVADFPDRWQVSGLELPVSYVYDPGAGHDGVTIEVRLEQLGVLEPEPFTWQVPGLREDLATALIRSLPKRIRTSFVPAPDFARRAVAWLRERGTGDETAFPEALGRALTALTGERVASGDWRPEAVDSHLRPTFVVVEGRKEVGRGEDLVALKTRLSAKVASRLTRSAGRIATTGRTDWDFGKLPLTQRLGGGVVGHPCLVDEGGSVGVQVVDSAVKAERLHAAGVRRLLTLVNPSPIRWVVSHLGNPEKLALGASRYGSVPELLEDAWLKASDRLLRVATDPVRVRDGQEFQRVAEVVRADCPAATAAVVGTAARALAAQAVVERRLAALPEDDEVRADITEQLANLTFKRFISATPDPWFDRIPVWIEACGTRLVTRGRNPARDERNRSEIMELEARYGQLCEAQPSGPLPADVEEIAFLLEEFRVSLFAQGTRTLVPVSAKRISQAMGRIGR